MKAIIWIFFLAELASCLGFFPSTTRLGTSLTGRGQSKPATELNAINKEKRLIESKLMPPFTGEELNELMKEFNITSYDINNDPELEKWGPSKQFFEEYGFQNFTDRYKRTVSDVKTDFYAAYRRPILPQYKTFLADLMTVTFIQSVDARYKYDALHAFGICTQYYTIMKGYALSDEIDIIFNEIMKAVGFDPVKLREDAKRILTLIKESTLSDEDFLNQQEGELADIFNHVRKNRFFKYCDGWGIGLGRMLELRGIEVNEKAFDLWAASLKWVFSPRIMQSWTEFCGDQLRMQGVEAMQKQLLIREKRRAAERLEKKAAAFEDKKKALLELNLVIEERRQQLISEQMELKKKYEPEEYERLTAGRQLTAGADVSRSD
eukprot:gene5235-5767_t